MFKVCNKCKRELPIKNFYKHKEMLDGYLNQCKECVKNRVASHRANNIEKIREYDRKRGNSPKRQQLRNEITKKRRHEVDGYQKSHNAIVRAIKKGILTRANTCQICGNQGKTEAHHFDYHITLKVIWLCPACHRQYHSGKSEKAEQIRKIVDMMLNIKKIG